MLEHHDHDHMVVGVTSSYVINVCHYHDASSINNRTRIGALDTTSPRITFRHVVLFGFPLTTNPNIDEMFFEMEKTPLTQITCVARTKFDK